MAPRPGRGRPAARDSRRTAPGGPQLLGVEHVAPPPAPAVPELTAGDAERIQQAGQPPPAR